MKQKILIRATGILMAFAVLFSCLLMAETNGNEVRKIAKKYASTLFQKDQVMEVNIIMEEEDWQEMLNNAKEETYIPCDVEVNGVLYKNVAIRPKGNTSLTQVTNDRYSFKIQFDKYQEGQSCDGLDQLILNNNFSDATYMKEYLAYDMFQYLGVVTPLYSYADVKVNGETYGLYLALEGVKESFAERNYGADHGELYKPESEQAGMGGGRQEGEQGNRKPPMEAGDMSKEENMPSKGNMPSEGDMTSEGNTPSEGDMPSKENISSEGNMPSEETMPEQGRGNPPSGDPLQQNSSSGGGDLVYTDDNVDSYSDIFDNAVFDSTKLAQKRLISALKGIQSGEDLSSYMDVTANLKYFAVNSFLVNYDSYTGNLKHNYYLYEKDGILTMLPWDLNLAFAGYQSNDATSAINDPIDTPVSGTTLEQRPMLGQLLNNETYLEEYHQYMDELVKGYIESGRYQAVITQVKQLISSYVKQDPTAFYTYDEYETAVENLESFCKLRGESVRGQLNGTIPSTEEGQKAESANLIDAGDLSITAMGTIGGGNHGNFGAFMTDKKTVATTTDENGKEESSEATKEVGNVGENENKQISDPMVRPDSDSTDKKVKEDRRQHGLEQSNTNSIKDTLIVSASCILILILAYFIIRKIPIKKYRV